MVPDSGTDALAGIVGTFAIRVRMAVHFYVWTTRLELRMSVRDEIKAYIAGQPQPKRHDMQALHKLILQAMPQGKLWFLDGRNEAGKSCPIPASAMAAPY